MNPLLKVNPPRPGLNPLKGKVNPLRVILSKQCNKSRKGRSFVYRRQKSVLVVFD